MRSVWASELASSSPGKGSAAALGGVAVVGGPRLLPPARQQQSIPDCAWPKGTAHRAETARIHGTAETDAVRMSRTCWIAVGKLLLL